MESDADRRDMLLAVGGQKDVSIGDTRLSVALFTTEPLDHLFDGIRVSSEQPRLSCLHSEIKPLDVKSGDAVTVPGHGDFYVAEVLNETGLAVIELRSEP